MNAPVAQQPYCKTLLLRGNVPGAVAVPSRIQVQFRTEKGLVMTDPDKTPKSDASPSKSSESPSSAKKSPRDHKKKRHRKKSKKQRDALKVYEEAPQETVNSDRTQKSSSSSPGSESDEFKDALGILDSPLQSPPPPDELAVKEFMQASDKVCCGVKMETHVHPDEPTKILSQPGVAESFIPVSFTTNGYLLKSESNSSLSSGSRTPKLLSPHILTSPRSSSSKSPGKTFSIDGIGANPNLKPGSIAVPVESPIQTTPSKRRKKNVALVEDLSKVQQLDVDDYIKKLMSCVDEDFKVKDYLSDTAIIEQICVLAIENLKKLPAMLEPTPPVQIVGDIHGQFVDLLRIFERCGPPESTRYLFLGDYVDRGPNSLETICLLLLLRIRYPQNVFMLRGNHECSTINRVYGFHDECEDRFQHVPMDSAIWGMQEVDLKGVQVWWRFQDVFNWLPLTALISKRILCMHGGLSPDLVSIEQLRNLERPIDPEVAGIHVDLLWSDPDPMMPNGETDADWGPSARGISSHFNVKAVNNACAKLGLDMIVRAHQVVQDGYEFFANRKLVTIFSAPNYCGEYNNSGAVMMVNESLGISFEIIKPRAGALAKKSKSTEVNFDDIDFDELIAQGSSEKT
uniref:Serine/threonine-protein phosphatase n=1 Tax=Panagrellus redivivus TaxID=6233 RepID=A0A7E4VYN1_PANRE